MWEYLAAIGSKLPFAELTKRILDRIPWLDLDRAKALRAHDLQRFEELDAILPEDRFRRFADCVYNLSIPEPIYKPVWHVLDDLQGIRNQMLIRSLETRRAHFFETAQALVDFLAAHVFAHGGASTVFLFMPDANPDRVGIGTPSEAHFQRSRAELYRLLQECVEAYNAFRLEAKRKLFV